MLPKTSSAPVSSPTPATGDSSSSSAAAAAVDYTNPAHAATLVVMMQHARLSATTAAKTTSCSAAAAGAAQGSAEASCDADAKPAEPLEAADCARPRRVVRRSSLASSTPAPRRSSLRCSDSSIEDSPGPDGSVNPRRPPARRRSSVTFSSDLTETKEVPNAVPDCPVRRGELFYKAEDYSQFRREHIREKKAEVRERAAMMMRWRSAFGSGAPGSKKTAAGEGSGSGGGGSGSSSPKIAAFRKMMKSSTSTTTTTTKSTKSTTTTTTAQFSSNFRRSVAHSQSSGVKPAVRTARLA